MKEIGGYIEFEHYKGSLYHDGAVALNCGRAALEYVLRAKDIRHIYLPYFCCDSVSQPCRKCGVAISYYHVNTHFEPVLPETLPDDAWLYLVNYYGQFNDARIADYKVRYPKMIVDDAQAYFQKPLDGVDTLYTCRKFFGVADGAFLYTDAQYDAAGRDESFDRMHFLLGRFERTASEFYMEYTDNNKLFINEPIKHMSKLTENLLRGIDYDFVRQRRKHNFLYLHEQLSHMNKLTLSTPDGAFMYPLYTDGGAMIRKKLQAEKIYIPTLWPDVFKTCNESDIEYDMAENILPLPIDQRYDENDMEHIVAEVMKCIS